MKIASFSSTFKFTSLEHMKKIAIIDDHSLIRHVLVDVIQSFEDYSVTLEAQNGNDFFKKLNPLALPDIALIDINMPIMDGYETVKMISKDYPQIKMMAVSIENNEELIFRMIKAGVRAYLNKDFKPAELKKALDSLYLYGIYLADFEYPLSDIQTPSPKLKELFTAKEVWFLDLLSQGKDYLNIAQKMNVNEDEILSQLHDKLHVKSRTSLVVYAYHLNLLTCF